MLGRNTPFLQAELEAWNSDRRGAILIGELESGDRVAIDSSPTSNQALSTGELDEWDGRSILF